MGTADKYGVLGSVEYGTDGTDQRQALALVASGKASMDQYLAWSTGRDEYLSEVARNAARSAGRELTCRVSMRGAVSVYGLNSKFPVTLHAVDKGQRTGYGQWGRLLDFANTLRQYIDQHRDEIISARDEWDSLPKSEQDRRQAAAQRK